jgi:N,N'-diacetyllegionaminate synthase
MNKVFIIAEAGVNHDGSLEKAKKLVEAAKTAGAHAVKFQTWKTESVVTTTALKAEYQVANTGELETQFEMLKKLELKYSDFIELKKYCDELKIIFISTPDEIESARFLESLQEVYKIGSGEITNLPFLRYVGSLKKQIIISSGMSNMSEIRDAIEVLVNAGTPKSKITALHCTSEYPAPMNDVNLNAINSMRESLGVEVGYSDHTLGYEVSIAAVALGATVIEKHLTLDRTSPGPDHSASIEPNEFAEMVKAISNIEKALGDGRKRIMPSELKNAELVRKSIVASCSISEGEMFTIENLAVKRPGTGINPIEWDAIIGTFARKNYKEDDLIEKI